MDHLTEGRITRFKNLISRRQFDLTVVLENVHDRHNIGAVMRTCDAVGIPEIYVIFSEKHLQEEGIVAKTSSSGSKKWVKINYFENLDECLSAVKKKYKNIWATHLGEESKDLYELNLTEPTALLFGNEHDGVSAEALTHCTGNFIIPQFGMVQSLNISVACAVSLFEALRQRKNKGNYDSEFNEFNKQQKEMFDHFVQRQLNNSRDDSH